MTIFASDAALAQYLHLKLATNGWEDASLDAGPLGLAHELLESYREKSRLLAGHLCPPDRRLQDYLERHFADVAAAAGGAPRLPDQSFMLDKPGLARLLSLPVDRNEHHIPLLSSYRTKQGVLHNPKSDRRTTAGSFHVCAGGLPVPGDKKEVPKVAFARLFHAAVNPPADDLVLPYTATRPSPARCFVSLLIRPLVSPAIPSDDAHLAAAERTMEVRMFAPGSLVANLDFVEAIFGNAGNPHLPENDAALDTDHWTGNSGCLILAPHLVSCRKKDLGLPHVSAATPRQVKDGMCWSQEGELYNEGQAFKATCRTAEGVMVTLIADNYFGYCKKEVKTQISLAANLFGNAEEEHAGGALAFPSYDLGEEWRSDANAQGNGATWDSVVAAYGSLMEARPEGWGIDRRFPTIIYVPEDAAFTVQPARVVWHRHGRDQGISLRANHTYILPSGYKVRLEKHPGATSWRLVGTVAEAVFCHKPSTVSGGGKSEISKSIADAVIYGPQFVGDLKADLDQVAELLIRDYSGRLRPDLRPDYLKRPTRSILAPERSLGSVIKLFTPTTEFTDAYNTWLKTIPRCILTMLFCLKRLYRPEWGEQWRQRFSVDIVNGEPGHQLKVDGRPVTASYLRVGIDDDGSWRTYKLRQDFVPADKVQMEDDITASVVVPTAKLAYLADETARNPSVKLAQNCENRLFQRPDDAIHRGQDKQAEADLAGETSPSVFISNFQPLTPADAAALVDDPIGYNRWTEPMRRLIATAAVDPVGSFVVSSAHPRIVDGKPSKNPRYLQERPDRVDARSTWLAEVATRLHRRVPMDQPVLFVVNAVLPGRRNNPPDAKAGVRPLAVHNPIHYLELPELFMEFASSLTGKSPSTTGAGSEGALTKGPFNAIDAVADLENALVSMVLCGYDGFTTSAACIGPNLHVGHDISLLIPEIWARLTSAQRDVKKLIAEGSLERLKDFDFEGRRVLASRLGYRITDRFVHSFFGRVFDNPAAVFDEAMLKPESQSLSIFVDGIDNIVETQRRCAQQYLDDGAALVACPPLVAILDIMATGTHQGKGAEDATFRGLFTREAVIGTTWYRARLERKQAVDVALWTRHVAALEGFIARASHAEVAMRLDLRGRLVRANNALEMARSSGYLDAMSGTIGRALIG